MNPLRCLPQEERPRERLLRDGVESLSIPELIAIILGSGTHGKSVLDLSQEILSHFGSLEKLLDATVVELMQIKGIGKAKAIQLRAVFGIAAKCKKINALEKFPIESPSQAYELARSEIAEEKQEVLLVLLRDVRGCLIHREQVSVGTLSQVLVHPREVFYPAVRHKAYSMIIAHNHPSGDPTPSAADLELTRSLILSSRVMGIGLDDHLIVCPNAFISLREKGYLPQKSRY
jgi:DNA repair protein RadC